jgi:hypothetical protein
MAEHNLTSLVRLWAIVTMLPILSDRRIMNMRLFHHRHINDRSSMMVLSSKCQHLCYNLVLPRYLFRNLPLIQSLNWIDCVPVCSHRLWKHSHYWICVLIFHRQLSMTSSIDRVQSSKDCLKSLYTSIKETGINIASLRFLDWYVLLLSLKECSGFRCRWRSSH